MNTSTAQTDRQATESRAAAREKMRAAVIERYGSPDELKIAQVDRPTCGDDQAIVQVRAAGINPIDWRIRSGSLRFLLPTRFPLVLGYDIAGEIVETGAQAEQKGWRVGDSVMAFLSQMHGGGYAQFAAASSDVMAKKPEQISFEEAAAAPLAALTAIQSLRNLGELTKGDEVLVNGASGGVGTYAVQYAVALGARVTGVCSESNLEFVREQGAERVVDYGREDFTEMDAKFDIILDAVAKNSYRKCRRVLKSDGCYIRTVPSPGSAFFQLATYLLKPRCRNILARPNKSDMDLLATMLGRGDLRSVVQQVYPLEKAAQAHQESEAGHVRGKLVLAT